MIARSAVMHAVMAAWNRKDLQDRRKLHNQGVSRFLRKCPGHHEPGGLPGLAELDI
jgi:hypothetical protein